MGASDWITLFAVIVALGIGVSSLVQTQRLQKRERTERLLNEIIEWAIDIYTCGTEKDTKDWLELSDMIISKGFFFVLTKVDELGTSFKALRGKNKYISKVASLPNFGQDLPKYVNMLISDLEEHVELLNKFSSEISQMTEQSSLAMSLEEQEKLKEKFNKDTTSWWKEIARHRARLNESVIKVIDEATKIKTQNIGKKEENMSKEGEVTGSNEPTIKAIEAHLIRQDNEMKRGKWFALGAIGFAVALVAVSLWIGTGDLSLRGLFYNERGFLFGVGFLVMIISWVKQRKIKD